MPREISFFFNRQILDVSLTLGQELENLSTMVVKISTYNSNGMVVINDD